MQVYIQYVSLDSASFVMYPVIKTTEVTFSALKLLPLCLLFQDVTECNWWNPKKHTVYRSSSSSSSSSSSRSSSSIRTSGWKKVSLSLSLFQDISLLLLLLESYVRTSKMSGSYGGSLAS